MEMLAMADNAVRMIRFSHALREAMTEEMERDNRVITFGVNMRVISEVMHLFEKFDRSRAFETPISENSVTGMAIGLALAGYRPVLSAAGGWMMSAMEEMVTASQWRAEHAGKVNLPMVWLANAGGGFQTGAAHSHFPSGLLMNKPGIKIVAPSNPYDAKGLLKAAIRDDNPVCFLTHLTVGATRGPVPEDDYVVPIGSAKVVREGTDVTILAYSSATLKAIAVADALRAMVSVEVVDLRTIEPLDKETIFKSVRKTGRVIVTDEEVTRAGVSAEIAAMISEEAFDALRAPIMRMGRHNVVLPAGPLESLVLLSADRLRQAVETICRPSPRLTAGKPSSRSPSGDRAGASGRPEQRANT
jgi:acetoin:2,6-dichlorophenolindophenol oxidoreductase subunit beta